MREERRDVSFRDVASSATKKPAQWSVYILLLLFATTLNSDSVTAQIPSTPSNPIPGSISSPGPTLSSRAVTLSWGFSSGATYYDLGVRDLTTNVLVVNTTVSGTSYSTTLSADKPYRWNVAACNSAGCSSFTTPRYFQTPASIPATPTNPTPGSTSSPGPTLSSTSVTLSWSSSSGATYYDLGVRDLTTNVLVVNTTVSGTSYSTTLSADKPYRWNVAACNSAGCSSFTTPRYFQTPGSQSQPGALILSSEAPICDMSPPGPSPAVRLNWTASTNASYYELHRNDTLYATGILGTTFYNSANLNHGRSYSYFVRAVNPTGIRDSNIITISIPTTLCTETQPPGELSLSISSFCASAGNLSPAVSLSWSSSLGADSYHVYRDDLLYFNMPSSTDRTYEDFDVSLGQTYTYQIEARNSDGSTPSNVVQIAVEESACPDQLSFNFDPIPPDQAVNVPFPVTITVVDSANTPVPFTGTVELSASLAKVSPETLQIDTASKTLEISLDSASSNMVLHAKSNQLRGQSNQFVVHDPESPSSLIFGSVYDGIQLVDGATIYLDDGESLIQAVAVSGHYSKLVPCGTYSLWATNGNRSSSAIRKHIPCNSEVRQYLFLSSDCHPTNLTPILLVPGILGSTTHPWSPLPRLPRSSPSFNDARWDLGKWTFSNQAGLFQYLGFPGWSDLVDELQAINANYYPGCAAYTVPYDWRDPVDIAAADYLRKRIEQIKEETSSSKVNVIAHSMGGLIVRAYVQSPQYANDIDRLALVGTPNHGAPFAYFLWGGGDPLGPNNIGDLYLPDFYYLSTLWAYFDKTYIWLGDNPLLPYPTLQRLFYKFYHANVPSLQQLLPTEPFLINDLEDPHADLCPENTNQWLEELNQDSTTLARFGTETESGKVRTKIFRSGGRDTPTSLRTHLPKTCGKLWADGRPRLLGVLEGPGDGTVPYDSASMPAESVSYHDSSDNFSHNNLMDKFANEICGFIFGLGQSCPQQANSTTHLSGAATSEQSRLTISLSGRYTIHVEDPLGRSIGISPNSGEYEEGIPGATFDLDATSVSASIENPLDGTYTLHVSGWATDDCVLSFEYMNGSERSSAVRTHISSPSATSYLEINHLALTPFIVYKVPSAPQGVEVRPSTGTPTRTTIVWTPSPSEEVVAYNVYGRESGVSTLKLLGQVLDSPFESGILWDGDAEIETMMFGVTAVTLAGEESFVTNLLSNNDRDLDGLPDELEELQGTDAGVADSDDDGLSDGAEYGLGTDPLNFDTDRDGFSDGVEIEGGFDPLDALDIPIDLVLADKTIAGPRLYQACNSITALADVQVAPSDLVSFIAGSRLVFGDGFSIESGASFQAVVGPVAGCPSSADLGASFVDDFEDNSINSAGWVHGGNTVSEVNRELHIERTVTDDGGWAQTVALSFNPTRPLILSRKVKIFAANSYFDGVLSLEFVGYPDYRFGVSYANYHYTGNNECVTVGFSVFRNDANSHSCVDQATDVSVMIPPVWDQWFDERLVFDPVSGRVDYYIDNALEISYNVGPVPAGARELVVHFGTWGWYTGHYQYMDDFALSQ